MPKRIEYRNTFKKKKNDLFNFDIIIWFHWREYTICLSCTRVCCRFFFFIFLLNGYCNTESCNIYCYILKMLCFFNTNSTTKATTTKKKARRLIYTIFIIVVRRWLRAINSKRVLIFGFTKYLVFFFCRWIRTYYWVSENISTD